MDTVRLRTMSWKSYFGNNTKYKDLTVQGIIDSGRGQYLGWCYYNYDKISYLPDVLKRLEITGKLVIAKPGKAPELFETWKARFIATLSEPERIVRETFKERGKNKGKTRLELEERKNLEMTKEHLKNKQYQKSVTHTGKIK